jgi:hypothetical protein
MDYLRTNSTRELEADLVRITYGQIAQESLKQTYHGLLTEK